MLALIIKSLAMPALLAPGCRASLAALRLNSSVHCRRPIEHLHYSNHTYRMCLLYRGNAGIAMQHVNLIEAFNIYERLSFSIKKA